MSKVATFRDFLRGLCVLQLFIAISHFISFEIISQVFKLEKKF